MTAFVASDPRHTRSTLSSDLVDSDVQRNPLHEEVLRWGPTITDSLGTWKLRIPFYWSGDCGLVSSAHIISHKRRASSNRLTCSQSVRDGAGPRDSASAACNSSQVR